MCCYLLDINIEIRIYFCLCRETISSININVALIKFCIRMQKIVKIKIMCLTYNSTKFNNGKQNMELNYCFHYKITKRSNFVKKEGFMRVSQVQTTSLPPVNDPSSTLPSYASTDKTSRAINKYNICCRVDSEIRWLMKNFE